MFSKLARNTFTAMRHPALGVEYLQWMVGQTIGHPLVVNGPFGTRLHASTFADLRSTRHFVPQPREVEMIIHLPSTQAVFIDIGANVGAWTTALAAAHTGCRVLAFEPAADTFEILEHNIALNGLHNVTALPWAVAESNDVRSFQINPTASIFNRLKPRANAIDFHRGRFDDGSMADVSSVRLDDVCREHAISRIDFLKIDVEGAELCVLRGADDLLKRRAISKIFMEVDPENLEEMGDSLEKLVTFMTDARYSFHALQPDGTAGPPVDLFRHHSLNMLAQPAA